MKRLIFENTTLLGKMVEIFGVGDTLFLTSQDPIKYHYDFLLEIQGGMCHKILWINHFLSVWGQ